MKNILILLPVVLLLAGCEIAETNDSKAKKLIKNYFKETLNDYDSYSPVSYSTVDSSFAKVEWELPKELIPVMEQLDKCAEKINESNHYADVTRDFSEPNERIISTERRLKYGELTPKEAKSYGSVKQLWIEFKRLQDIINASKANVKYKFTGWKITHKYRAKNQFNATILKNIEFHFDKELSRITAQWEIDAN